MTWNWFIAFLPVLFVTFIATIALVAIDVLLIWLGMPEEKEEEEDEEGMGERDGFLGEDQEKVRPFTTKEKIELLSNSVTVSLLLVFEVGSPLPLTRASQRRLTVPAAAVVY